MAHQHWINQAYLNSKTQQELKKEFKKNMPFPYLQLKNFLNEKKAQQLLQALQQEQFELKQADLFQFSQTKDLNGTKNKVLQEFRSLFVSPDFLACMKTMTGITLKPKTIDIAGTWYRDTDFLLCHDDQLEGRAIAFLYYLTDLVEKDGGRLLFYNAKNGKPDNIAKAIPPLYNTLLFFEVSPTSFHAVEEVMRNVSRYTIGGWFHHA